MLEMFFKMTNEYTDQTLARARATNGGMSE